MARNKVALVTENDDVNVQGSDHVPDANVGTTTDETAAPANPFDAVFDDAKRDEEPVITRAKGIPIPTGRSPRKQMYPWDELDAPEEDEDGDPIYDSFTVPVGPKVKPATFHTLSATRNKSEKDKASKQKGYQAKEFVAKKRVEDGKEVVTVWRIK